MWCEAGCHGASSFNVCPYALQRRGDGHALLSSLAHLQKPDLLDFQSLQILAMATNGEYLFTAGSDLSIISWDCKTLKKNNSIKVHTLYIHCIAGVAVCFEVWLCEQDLSVRGELV